MEHTNQDRRRQRPTSSDDIAAALAAPFNPKDVTWRGGNVAKEKPKAMAMAYVDARIVRERLNLVLGIGGWKSRHYAIGESQMACEISIKIDGEWIGKTDGGWVGNVDAEGKVDAKQEQRIDMEAKGAFSTAFKRAAASWGVAEYLYDLESPWVECEKDDNGRFRKFTHNGLAELERVAAEPYMRWKTERDARRAAEAKAERDARAAEAAKASPPPVAAAAPAAAPTAEAVAPAEARAADVDTSATTAPKVDGAATVEGAPPTTTSSAPTTSPDALKLVLDRFLTATTAAELQAHLVEAFKDPLFAEGTPARKIVKAGFTESMQRFHAGWDWDKAEAAAKAAKAAKGAKPVKGAAQTSAQT